MDGVLTSWWAATLDCGGRLVVGGRGGGKSFGGGRGERAGGSNGGASASYPLDGGGRRCWMLLARWARKSSEMKPRRPISHLTVASDA
jgi:hypothetical protein